MIRISAALGVIAALAFPAMGQAQQNARTFKTSTGEVRVETIARGLNHPWGLAFLPNGRMLVTEREGRLRIVAMDGSLSKPVSDVPKVYANNQGGLFDIVLDRDYAKTQMVYFCYAEPSGGASRTAVARAKLIDEGQPRLEDVKVIFRQEPATSRGMHYGCRIAQARDNNLFVTLGDHFTQRDEAQKLDNHIGKIVRITPDGAAPSDNPFVKRSDAKPEIYSYGHRNSQGAQVHPDTSRFWMHEHGPRGGDEINLPEPGKNYGWPVIGYGVDYSGAKIHKSTAQDGMEQPLWHWTPSIAPSGMAFYVGQLFPQWKDNLFVGALSGKMLVRLEVQGQRIVREERMLSDLGERIRDVRVGPDGALFLLTDAEDGRILRLSPASPKL